MSENRGVPMYPNNSDAAKENANKNLPAKTEKVEKVIEGNATVKKASLGQRIMDNIFDGSIEDRLTNAVFDIFIPSAKKMFADGVIDLVSTLLTGQPVRNRGQSRGGSTTVRNNPLPYNSMYDYGGGSRRDVGERSRRITPDEIVVNTRDEAESVCRKLEDLMQLYGYVTVDDFYSTVGVPSQYTDRKWGWKSFGGGYPNYEQVPGGYLIVMPRVEPV